MKTQPIHPLPLLTAALSLFFAAICGFALLTTYNAANYKAAADCGIFAVIFAFYAVACLLVNSDRAAVREFHARYPHFKEK